jgi:hypothetical protein
MKKKLLTCLCLTLAMGWCLSIGQQTIWNDAGLSFDTVNPQSQPVTHEFMHGSSWMIEPILYDNGVPHAWATNSHVLFFWQTPAMKTNWFASTNCSLTVCHTVATATTQQVLTTQITNLTWYTYTPVVTNIGGTNYTVLATNIVNQGFTNTSVSYVVGYSNVVAVDTGRVAVIWNGTMETGANSYNWVVGISDGTNVNYSMNGAITIAHAPGYTGSFTNFPALWPWANTNLALYIWNQSLWLTNDISNPGYFYLMAPN